MAALVTKLGFAELTPAHPSVGSPSLPALLPPSLTLATLGLHLS